MRTAAWATYHSGRADYGEVVKYARANTANVLGHYKAAMIAARAAYRSCDDAFLETLLDKLIDRFPAQAGPLALRAKLRGFQGRYADALSDCDRARFLAPSKSTTAASLVSLTYLAGARDADQVAVESVQRFPRTTRVWWASAKSCRTTEQFERLIATWRELSEPTTLPRFVRPLAAAAARAGNLEAACQLYRDAMQLLIEHNESISAVRPTTLEGRGAWTAIEDLVDVLDTAAVPFFFAAGTALGLVREGRPLDLDGDIDVGIFERDWNRDLLHELFSADGRFMPDILHPRAQKLGLKHRAGSTIDLFRFYNEDGQLWHNSAFTRWHNSPFSADRQVINGCSVPLPTNVGAYLAENYGDWQIPNPGFDAFTPEAPNVESTWPEYSHFHLLRRAFARFSHSDVPSAFAELTNAGEDELIAKLEVASG